MLKDVNVPEVAENVAEGKVIGLLVGVGDVVEVDQSLLELETDKAVVAIPSPFAGKVAEILVGEGDTVAVGAAIMRLDTEGGGGDEAAPAPAKKRDEAQDEAQETAEAADEAAEAAAAEATGPEEEAEPSRRQRRTASALRTERESAADRQEPPPASPAVRRLARELGVDIRAVRGSGPGGRIDEGDLRAHVRRTLGGGGGAPAPDASEASIDAHTLPDFTRWGPVRTEKLSTVREITGRTMTRAWTTIPQVTQYDKADITELDRFRRGHAAAGGADAPALTLTAILLKVCAVALREFPRFNASLDWPRREIVFKDYVNVGVAVDTERGLLVPVVRDADAKGVLELAAELADLAERARGKRIKPDELEGGNFTISNLGGIGGTAFSPIVYPPQVAILGVDRAETEAVWRDGGFAPRLRLPLSLSYDHRAIDGAEGARFLRWICETLEQPLQLAMKGRWV